MKSNENFVPFPVRQTLGCNFELQVMLRTFYLDVAKGGYLLSNSLQDKLFHILHYTCFQFV